MPSPVSRYSLTFFLSSSIDSVHFTDEETEIIEVKHNVLEPAELFSLQYNVPPSRGLWVCYIHSSTANWKKFIDCWVSWHIILLPANNRAETLQIFQLWDSNFSVVFTQRERRSNQNKPWDICKITWWSKFILQELLMVILFTSLWIAISLVSLLPIKLMCAHKASLHGLMTEYFELIICRHFITYSITFPSI